MILDGDPQKMNKLYFQVKINGIRSHGYTVKKENNNTTENVSHESYDVPYKYGQQFGHMCLPYWNGWVRIVGCKEGP